MEPVKVPQNLELEDVLAFGLTAVDLLWLAGGGLLGWWLYLAVPGPLVLRVLAAAPLLTAGLVLGLGKLNDRPIRDWVVVLLAYARRSRRRVYGAAEGVDE